jgi:GINS complex subunit 2
MNYEQETISRDELNFFATEELITIKPNFYFGVMNLVGGQYGPFRPNKLIDVPLWVAVDLKKRGKCYFEIPPTYSPESLAQLIRMEEEFKETVSPLAQDFFQLFQILEENAAD